MHGLLESILYKQVRFEITDHGFLQHDTWGDFVDTPKEIRRASLAKELILCYFKKPLSTRSWFKPKADPKTTFEMDRVLGLFQQSEILTVR